jgi:hypothetical protein
MNAAQSGSTPSAATAPSLIPGKQRNQRTWHWRRIEVDGHVFGRTIERDGRPLAGEELLAGRKAIVLDATPRPGYKASKLRDRHLRKAVSRETAVSNLGGTAK